MVRVSFTSCKKLPFNRILAALIVPIVVASVNGTDCPIRHQQATRVMVGDVDFGMDLRSPPICGGPAPDCCGLQRHYASNVDPQGFAAKLQISDDNQLLAVDGNSLVGDSHQTVLNLFHNIVFGESFTLTNIDVDEVNYTFSRSEAAIDMSCMPMSSAISENSANCLHFTEKRACSGRSNSLQCNSPCRKNGLSSACFWNVADYNLRSHNNPNRYLHADCGMDAISLSSGLTSPLLPFTFYLAEYDVPSWWLTGDGDVFTIATECDGEYKFVKKSGSNGVQLSMANSNPYGTQLKASSSFCFEESARNQGRFRMVSPAKYLQEGGVSGSSVGIQLGNNGIEFDLY